MDKILEDLSRSEATVEEITQQLLKLTMGSVNQRIIQVERDFQVIVKFNLLFKAE